MRNSQRDAIYRSDLILVGDLTSGQSAAQNGVIDCNAKVHASLIIKGQAGIADDDLLVHWQYPQAQPNESSGDAQDLGRLHALWFLKKGAGGMYEAMWAEMFQRLFGGYLIPIPEATPTATSSHPVGGDYQAKLAGELVSALETLAQSGGDRLNIDRRQEPSGKVFQLAQTSSAWFETGSPESVRDDHIREQFQSLAELFNQLDPSRIQDLSQRLLARPEIYLKAIGLMGELRARKGNALFIMEKLYPQLAMISTWVSFGLAAQVAQINIRGNHAAIEAVGRMCVSETRIFPFAENAITRLADTKAADAVPYLQTMLLFPNVNVRASAARGICEAVAADPAIHAMADHEMTSACRLTTVAANRIDAHTSPIRPSEPLDINELSLWLSKHSAELLRATGTLSPSAPKWFAATVQE